MDTQVAQELDKLIDQLDSKLSQQNGPGPRDAIDEVLNTPARTTKVVSLREAPEVESFRQALVDGLIRVDTVNQLLRLLSEVIVRLA